MVRIKRAYEEASARDGHRVLVDRLWPRGIKKEALPLDAWEKALSPSDALRKWFGHDPSRWEAFQSRYRAELRANTEARAILDALAKKARSHTVTLVYGARDEEHNQAVVVRDEIERLLHGAHEHRPHE